MDGHNEPQLPEPRRRLHRALIDAMLATGGVPGLADLARELAIAPEDARAGLRALAAADYLWFDAAGRLTCLYPFSLVPTPHVVDLGGQRRYAMCALDALGVAAMLRREVTVDGRCATCGSPIHLTVQPGVIAAADPPATVVVARRPADAPASEVCCPFTLFACGPDHAQGLVASVPQTEVLSLAEGLTVGEGVFGDLLGPTLAARRRRSSDIAAGQ